MLTLYYSPGACSMAAHIILEESGQPYEAKRVDLVGGEQRTEAYRKIHPLGRVPALMLENGTPIAENTAILPYLGKRFGIWPGDPTAEAKALSLIGFFAASVHPAHAQFRRPERYATDEAAFPTIRETGRNAYKNFLRQIDGMLAGREWFLDSYSAIDPYGLVFYSWGLRFHELPMAEYRNYTAFRDRMLARPGVRAVLDAEKIAA